MNALSNLASKKLLTAGGAIGAIVAIASLGIPLWGALIFGGYITAIAVTHNISQSRSEVEKARGGGK